jgi:hypothetical protein
MAHTLIDFENYASSVRILSDSARHRPDSLTSVMAELPTWAGPSHDNNKSLVIHSRRLPSFCE